MVNQTKKIDMPNLVKAYKIKQQLYKHAAADANWTHAHSVRFGKETGEG